LYDEWSNDLIVKPNLRPNQPILTSPNGTDYGLVEDHPLS